MYVFWNKFDLKHGTANELALKTHMFLKFQLFIIHTSIFEYLYI